MVTGYIIFLFILTGCIGTEKQNLADDKKISELEQQIEELQQQVSYVKKEPTVSHVETTDHERPPVIKLIDPSTFTVIKTISPYELGYDLDYASYVLEIEQLAKDLARGSDSFSGFDQRMVLDKLDSNGQIIKGSPMVILKESELVENILAVSSSGGHVELPLYKTESSYNVEDLPRLQEVVVASYTTYFNTADPGRNKNIELSAKAINNVIVGSGDQFSFNMMVGPRDEENGYQPAPEIINSKLVMGIGGGVCQTSSTLYNAVDQVLIDSIERHHHSLDVGYVPKGQDATVAYGISDYRFQNVSSVPFLIKANYGNGSLTIEVRTSKDYASILKKP